MKRVKNIPKENLTTVNTLDFQEIINQLTNDEKFYIFCKNSSVRAS